MIKHDIKAPLNIKVPPNICVSATSFCRNPLLREELQKIFPHARFHNQKIDLQEDELIDFIADADCLICGTEKITARVLNGCAKLRFISKYGVGINNLDLTALDKKGVEFAFTPGINAHSVAEMTLCFLLGLAHHMFENGYRLKKGVWQKEGGQLLQGKTVGIIGCGHVGSKLLQLLQPFSCRILVNDIVDKTELLQTYHAIYAEKETIYQQADFITLHLPLTPFTKNLIDRQELASMNENSYLINTSRGEIVNQEALKQALQQTLIAGAAVDVFAIEPPVDQEFLSLPNLMPTPHIGGSAREARLAMGQAAIRQLLVWLQKNVD